MKSSDRQKMLNEVFAGEELEKLRQSTVATGRDAMRRKRRNNAMSRLSLVVLVPALMTLSIFWLAREPIPYLPLSQATSTAPRKASDAPNPLTTISDDELLALFPNQGVALIGKPGNQRLLIFDRQSL
jgi:hypothetical protein